MGAVSFSIDIKLIEQLKQVLPLPIFVETGTFEGETVQQAIGLFEEIHSVELSKEYYLQACDRFRDEESVKLYHNSSKRFLQELYAKLQEKSVLYWLDAHWCVANATAGSKSQCPLLEELGVIHALNAESVILIDDARLFLCTPPKPHTLEDWPTLDAILQKLYSISSSHEVMVVNDAIIYYPTALSLTIRQYAHENSIDWLHILNEYRSIAELRSQLEAKEAVIQELIKASRDRLTVIEQQQQAIEQIKQQNKATVQELRETVERKQQRIDRQAQKLQEATQAIESTWDRKLRNRIAKLFRRFK